MKGDQLYKEYKERENGQPNIVAGVLFVLALFLCCLGIYHVIAYWI